MAKYAGNFELESYSAPIMEQIDLDIEFWENAPKTQRRELLTVMKEKVNEEDTLPAFKKGTRKPTTRLERRKATFRHKSEREKKMLRRNKGYDVRSWDKFPYWGEETINERKAKETLRDAFRDMTDYEEEIRQEEITRQRTKEREIEKKRQIALDTVINLEDEIVHLQRQLTLLKGELAETWEYYHSLSK